MSTDSQQQSNTAQDEQLAILVSMGFDPADAKNALESTNGGINDALNFLTSGSEGDVESDEAVKRAASLQMRQNSRGAIPLQAPSHDVAPYHRRSSPRPTSPRAASPRPSSPQRLSSPPPRRTPSPQPVSPEGEGRPHSHRHSSRGGGGDGQHRQHHHSGHLKRPPPEEEEDEIRQDAKLPYRNKHTRQEDRSELESWLFGPYQQGPYTNEYTTTNPQQDLLSVVPEVDDESTAAIAGDSSRGTKQPSAGKIIQEDGKPFAAAAGVPPWMQKKQQQQQDASKPAAFTLPGDVEAPPSSQFARAQEQNPPPGEHIPTGWWNKRWCMITAIIAIVVLLAVAVAVPLALLLPKDDPAPTPPTPAPTEMSPDEVSFDPNALQATPGVDGGVSVGDGSQSLLTFDTQQEAEAAIQVMKFYNMDSIVYVGRPDPSYTFFLVNGEAPAGPFEGEICDPINRDELSIVTVNLQDGDSINIQFPSSREALEAKDYIDEYEFDYLCFFDDRRDPAVSYSRRDVNTDPTPSPSEVTTPIPTIVTPSPSEVTTPIPTTVSTMQPARDEVFFDPGAVQVTQVDGGRWGVGDGNQIFMAFGNRNVANFAVDVIEDYEMKSVVFVGGRDDPGYIFFLVDGDAPEGSLRDETCNAINKEGLEIVRVNDQQFEIYDGMFTHMTFRTESDAMEAQTYILLYQFDWLCFFGPNQDAARSYSRRDEAKGI